MVMLWVTRIPGSPTLCYFSLLILLWLFDSMSLFLWPRPSSPRSCLLFSIIKWQKQESSTEVPSHIAPLRLSFSVCVFYLLSFLNQEKVAWARPGVCQKITPSVWAPTPGLWLSAWHRLWSWLSMPYRSARRGEKRSSAHTLIPKAEGVIYQTDIKTTLWDMNDICEWRKTKGKRKQTGGEKKV